MEKVHIEERVERYIREEILDGESIQPDTPLFSAGLINSMNLVRLLSFLEEEFDQRIPTAQVNVNTLDTIESITEMVFDIKNR
ncbi:MAG: phosphopantetheine-binding protein [Pseudomonadota bacterium]